MTRSLPALALLLAARAALAADPDSGVDGFTVDTSGSSRTAAVGGKGKLAVAIQPKAPWHVDPRAPLKIRMEAPAGLALEKSTFARKDALDPKAEVPRFETPFQAKAAGTQEAKAHLDFFLCKDTICAKQTATVALPVTVQ